MAKTIQLSNGNEIKFNTPTAGMLRRAMDIQKGEGSRAFYIIGECTNMSLEELDKLSLEDINLLSETLNEYQAPSSKQ
ncbi:phage tail assembly protein [Campylobacter estrildidarum]|uniref:Phage tail assembly protein n=1 Tax=Campylobacter estrildidarum TaxID=2510189 RepID=A0A4V6DVT7_9BACT|nr:phage tail assembly protein [Campylobacter estrildidarum]TKX29522.1 phage tail assembly protein [Campylobacter estrildidarum]